MTWDSGRSSYLSCFGSQKANASESRTMRGTMRERTPGVRQLRMYAGRDEQNRPVQVAKTVHGGKFSHQAAEWHDGHDDATAHLDGSESSSTGGA